MSVFFIFLLCLLTESVWLYAFNLLKVWSVGAQVINETDAGPENSCTVVMCPKKFHMTRCSTTTFLGVPIT
jgi:hypothetical protein